MGRRLENGIWSALMAHLAAEQHGRASTSPSSFNQGQSARGCIPYVASGTASRALLMRMRVAGAPLQEAI
jgi:hypothetical protein